MQYIRFLKAPRLELHPKSKTRGTISALITITSDLGESYMFKDCVITAAVFTSEKSPISSRRFQWTAGMRSLHIEIAIESFAFKSILLGVYPENGAANNISNQPNFSILSAWSSEISCQGQINLIERRLDIGTSRPLSIWEDGGNSIARHVWDGGLVLASLIAQAVSGKTELCLPSFIHHLTGNHRLNVLEIGSGCGVVGLTLAQLRANCHIILTDLPLAEDIIRRNMRHMLSCKNVEFGVLDWDQEVPAEISSQKFDILLVADCMYNVDSAPALVNTITSVMATSPDALLVVAHKKRHDSESLFFDLMSTFSILDKASIAVGDADEEVDLYTMRLLPTKDTETFSKGEPQ
ncbi:putative methyltransferase-domain-containing protein [Geopyxis carbonaria]|nr:putative methyltransferase-domain-containing protein [Geopyxis carbonaria]